MMDLDGPSLVADTHKKKKLNSYISEEITNSSMNVLTTRSLDYLYNLGHDLCKKSLHSVALLAPKTPKLSSSHQTHLEE